MLMFKFTHVRDGRQTGPYQSHYEYKSMPKKGQPSALYEVKGPLRICGHGFHAYSPAAVNTTSLYNEWAGWGKSYMRLWLVECVGRGVGIGGAYSKRAYSKFRFLCRIEDENHLNTILLTMKHMRPKRKAAAKKKKGGRK